MEKARCVLLRSLRALALRGTASYLHTTGVVVTYEYSLLKLVLDQGIQMDSSQLVSGASTPSTPRSEIQAQLLVEESDYLSKFPGRPRTSA